jgi:ribosomal protein S18 acetylase RimI-like enzyme
MPVKIGQPIGTPQDFTAFDPNKFLTAPDSPAPSRSVDTGLYKISYAKAAPTNAVPALNPINGEWTPEVIASQNARADEFNPPTESALRERSYNEALNPLFQLTQGPLKPQAPRKLTEDEWWASQTPRVEKREVKTLTGEIGEGNIFEAIGVAYKTARESLEPFFGPTEEQFNNEKVPWGTNPDGSVKYEYKPLGSRLDKTGLLMTPLLETKMMEPKPGDTSLDAAGKATFNFMAGLVNFGLSGLGIATVGLGGATKAATRIAGFAPAGLGAESSVAAQTAARLAATARVVSGGFAIDMASAVPEQYKAATESPTLQGRIEGWLGTVSSLAFATLAAKHAAKKPLELAERQTLESVVELAKRTPDAVLEAVARNMEADVYSRNLAKAELQRRQIEQQAALAPEAAAAAEAAGPAIPSGTAGAPGTKAGGLTHTEVVLDSELGTQKIEVKDGDTVVGYIAFGNDLNGYDTINMVWVKPEYRGKGISTELYRRALASAKERGRKGLASTDANLQTPEKTKSTRRNFIVRESTDKADTKKALELSGKAHDSVHFIEGEKASSAPVAKPTTAAAEGTATTIPSGTAGAPDPAATAVGVIKTAAAADAAGRPIAAPALEVKVEAVSTTEVNRAPDVSNPDNLSAKDWINKRVSEGATREEAIAERDKANADANAWLDALPTGTVVRSKNGMDFVKESDGTLRRTNGAGVHAGSVVGMEVVKQPATKPPSPAPSGAKEPKFIATDADKLTHIKGARGGYYKNGVPLKPEPSGNFGPGYYIAEGDLPSSSVMEFIPNPVSGLEARADVVWVDAPRLLRIESGVPIPKDVDSKIKAELEKQADLNEKLNGGPIRTRGDIDGVHKARGIGPDSSHIEIAMASIMRNKDGRIVQDSLQGGTAEMAALAKLIYGGEIPYDGIRAVAGRTYSGKMKSEIVVQRPEQIKIEKSNRQEQPTPTPAPSPAPAAPAPATPAAQAPATQKSPPLPKPTITEPLTVTTAPVVVERVKVESTKPKGAEPTVEQTLNEALDANGDLSSAWESLDNQVKALEGDKANKATVARLEAAKRKIANTLEEEHQRSERAQVEEQETGKYDLLESVKQLGKLPSATSKHAKEAVGELKRIKESSKGAITSLFSKDAGSLDTLREGLAERGFQFDTYFQMLEAIEAANTSGKSVLGSQFPKNYKGGPGAMGPVERAQFEAERKVIGASKEMVTEQRAERGLDPLMSKAKEANPVTWDAAVDRIEKDPGIPARLVEDIRSGEKKSTSREEKAELLYEMTDLTNKLKAETERSIDENSTPAERAEAQANAEGIERQLIRTEEAARMAGSDTGAALQFMQVLANENYTYAGLMMRERKLTGDVVPKERAQEIKKIADKYKKAQAELDLEKETRQKLDESAAMEAVVVEMERELEAAAKTGATYHPSVMQHAKEIVERAKGEAADAWKRIRSQMGSESGAVGGVGGPKGEGKYLGQPTRQQIAAQNRATLINDVALILKARVYEFGVKMAEAAQYVLLRSGDMGDSIRPILARAVAKANTMMERELNTRPQKVKEAVKTGATAPEKQPKAKPTPESYIDKGKVSVVAGDDPLYRKEIGEAIDGGNVTVETHKLMISARRLVYDIVTAHWENGVRGTDALMDAALKTVQEFLPDATLRDVHRAYGEYGKVKFPNKDALSMQLSAAYRETKLMEDIARMEKDDKDALRRGFTPEKPNLRQRELAQKRAELQKLRQGKPSPEKLAGIQQARQTAVKNRMEVLDKMLKNGEKPPVGSKVADDVFTEQLKSEKQAMQDLWNEIEAAKNPPPPKHIAELARLQDRADILRDRLARMELTQPKAEGKPTVDTAEIAAAKAEIKQLSDTMAELRKPIPLSDAQKALDSALVARERAGQTLDDISTGKVKDPAKIKEALTQLEEDVRLETDALKALAAEMRRDAKPKGDPGYLKEQSQIKALERAIASYADKVAKGNLAAKGKVQGPDSRRVAQLKAIRDSRQAAYQAAKNLGKPVLSPEQRYNATRLKALTKREADLRADIAAGRFAPKPKKVNPALDKATIDAELKVDAVKQEYLKSQFDWQKKQRNKPTIAKDAVMEAFSFARATMLSADLGFMGLQLGVRLITNPLLVLKNIPAAIKAGWGGTGTGRGWARLTGNERALDAVNKSIELRPEAKNGDLKKMGIVTSTSALKTEYALRGKLAEYVPVVAQSNRAMTAALNLIRADLARASIESYGQGFPIDAKTLKMLGNEINIVTGKGALGKAEIHRAMLNHFGLAPGWVISRFQFLYGQPVWEALLKGDKKAAGMFFRSYVKWAAGSLTLLSTAAFFHGDDWDEFKARLDPRSSRFGMIPIGNRIYDFSSGIIGPLVFLSRFITGERVTKDGEVISLRREEGKPKKFGAKSTTDLAFKFVQGKAAPIPGFILDLAAGEDVVGRPANFATALLNRTLPLTPRQMAQIASEEGIPGSVIPALLQFIGVNSRNEDISIEEGMDYDPVFQIADKLGVDPR